MELTEVRVTATRGGGSPMMGLGPNSPQIRISAARADNQKPVVVTIMVHELAFRAGHKYPATAHGGYSEGESGFFRRPLSLPIAGTVRFDQAGREQDDPVCGSFSLELLEMDEGHPPRESAAESSTADAE